MKIAILTIIVVCISSYNIYSQYQILKLWESKIPYQNKIEDEVYEPNNIKIIAKVNVPSIEIFSPSERSSNKKAVIICPGGGYKVLAYDWEGIDVARWLSSNGYTAIVLKYRLPDSTTMNKKEFVPLIDLQRAVRLVRANADKWKIDKNKIGIMGFSAGGHLVSTFGTRYGNSFHEKVDSIDFVDDKPNFMILAYPVVTFKEEFTHKGSRKFLIGNRPSTEMVKYFSNELYVSEKTPPTFIFHAQDDKSVPAENSILFYEALTKNKIKAELHIFEEGGHGFSLANSATSLKKWLEILLNWLEKF
ncbi:MAG: alpha/beta hydrolase [Melioribacteraceae bacterium]|nr:alpha/beta hydrolase [Melioribacteraceae bacterium]